MYNMDFNRFVGVVLDLFAGITEVFLSSFKGRVSIAEMRT
jgi:hypothetical protein